MAQSNMDSARIEITFQEVSSPTPNSFHLKQEIIIYSDSSYHPQLDAFRVALFLEDTLPNIKPFAYLDIPPTKATAKSIVLVDQDAKIADMDQWIAYNKRVLLSEEFRVAIRGRVGLHEMNFPATMVDFNKVATMKGTFESFLTSLHTFGELIVIIGTGLNRLEGFNVTHYDIKVMPEPDGANMVGTVSIPNPSAITINMGNVTMNLSVDGTPIGTSLLPNLVLKPGTHDYEMRSTTNQTAILGLIAQKYTSGVLPLEIIGNSSVADGQNLVYFEEAIKSNTLHVDLNTAPALQALGL